MLFKGSEGNKVLTSSNNTATFPAGYYEEFVVSTNIQNVKGTISYDIGHKHYGTANLTSPSGCYTQAYSSYEVTSTETEICSGPGEYSGHHWNSSISYTCDRCGHHAEDTDTTTHYYTKTNYGYVTRYKLGCGMADKQFVRTSGATDLAVNEQIISATITY